MEIIKEVWKPIKGYENEYLVSNLGQVKSLDRIRKNGLKKGKVLKPIRHSNGYLRVHLNRKDYFIHRLVAQAFIENPLNKEYVNHIDGDKTNNNVTNLEWTTPSENMHHAYYTLKYADGEIMRKHSTCENRMKATKKLRKLNDEQIKEIFILKDVMTQKEIALHYNCSRQFIGEILNNKIYKEV